MILGLAFKSEKQHVLLRNNMPAYHSRLSQFMVLLGDLLLLNLSFVLAAAWRFRDLPFYGTEYYDYYVQLWFIINLLWLALSLVFKTYNNGIKLEPRQSVSKALNVFSGHLFVLLLLLVSLQKSEQYSRLFLIYFYSGALLSIMPWHFFYLRFLRGFRQKKKPLRSLILIGEGSGFDAFQKMVKTNSELGLAIEYQVELAAGEWLKEKQVQAILSSQAEELFVALAPEDDRFKQAYRFAEENLLRFRALPNLGLGPMKAVQIDFYDQIPVLSFRTEPLQLWHNRWLKRILDIILSLVLTLLLYPIFLPIIFIGIKLSGKGPLLFKQKRSGYRDEEFYIYKFRSMSLNDKADTQMATADDDRITPFGKFMRRWHLDELPQLAQVFVGEMSLVGPRPHMLSHTEEYRDLVERYMLRHFVKPGLSGLAQVNGLKGEHDLKQMEERVKADVYYLENWSLLLDLSILIRTLGTLGKK